MRNDDEVTYSGQRTLLVNMASGSMSDGLFQSTDLGSTWTNVDPILDGHSLPHIGLWDGPADWNIDGMAWNHIEGPGSVILAYGRLYTSGGSGFSNGYGLWKSGDGGRTWRHIAISPDIGTDIDPYITSLALDHQGNALIEASHSLYRSTDAGETWKLATPPTASGYLQGLMYLGSHLPPPQRPHP